MYLLHYPFHAPAQSPALSHPMTDYWDRANRLAHAKRVLAALQTDNRGAQS